MTETTATATPTLDAHGTEPTWAEARNIAVVVKGVSGAISEETAVENADRLRMLAESLTTLAAMLSEIAEARMGDDVEDDDQSWYESAACDL